MAGLERRLPRLEALVGTGDAAGPVILVRFVSADGTNLPVRSEACGLQTYRLPAHAGRSRRCVLLSRGEQGVGRGRRIGDKGGVPDLIGAADLQCFFRAIASVHPRPQDR